MSGMESRQDRLNIFATQFTAFQVSATETTNATASTKILFRISDLREDIYRQNGGTPGIHESIFLFLRFLIRPHARLH